MRQDFLTHNIPFHVDGEYELRGGYKPRFWEYASAIVYSQVEPGMTILDAGSAHSLVTPWLAKNNVTVYANDRKSHWKQRLEQMAHIGKKFHIDLYDLARLGYPDNTFDRVFCLSVLEHIPEKSIPAVLKEVRRVMKNDAILAVTFNLYQEHIPYGAGNFHGAQTCQYFSPESIQQIFKESGFELIEDTFLDDTDWSSPPLFNQYNFGRIFLRKTKGNEPAAKISKRPLRIANISDDFYYGGIQEQVQILAEASLETGFEHVIVALDDGPLRDVAIENHIPNVVISREEIVPFCEAYEIDIVLTHAVNGTNTPAHLYVYDLFLVGIPIINIHYCAYPAKYPSWLFDSIVTNAQSTSPMLPQGADFCVVPLALNMQRIQCDLDRVSVKKKWGIPPDSLVIGRLSRLAPTKMIEDTILTMAEVKKVSHKSLYFIIGGAEAKFWPAGHYLTELRELAKKAGISKLSFTGALDPEQKAELLNILDINLAPTSYEGYGLIFVEPAYCGVPTVTYDHSANKEVVGEGGLIVPFGNREALVNTTLRLIDDEEFRLSIGDKARIQVLDRNPPTKWRDAIHEIVELAIEQNSLTFTSRPLRIDRPYKLRLEAGLILKRAGLSQALREFSSKNYVVLKRRTRRILNLLQNPKKIITGIWSRISL